MVRHFLKLFVGALGTLFVHQIDPNKLVLLGIACSNTNGFLFGENRIDINDFTPFLDSQDRALINPTVPHIYIYPIIMKNISTQMGKVPLQYPILFKFLRSTNMPNN